MAKSKTGFKKMSHKPPAHVMEASRARMPREIAAAHGEREPRGAAGGAAFNRSRRSTYEPSAAAPDRRNTQKTRGRPAQIRARISELTAMALCTHHFKTLKQPWRAA